MESRPVPGTSIGVSVIALSVPAPGTVAVAPSGLSPDSLVRAAAGSGIRLIVAVGSESVEGVVGLLRSMPAPPQGRVLAVGVDPTAPGALPKGASPAEGELAILPMVRSPRRDQLREPRFAKEMTNTLRESHTPIWGASWSSPAEAVLEAPAALDAGARILALPASLLAYEDAVTVGQQAVASGACLLALDPFAAGALDGSFLSLSPLDRPRPAPPPSVTELGERLAPVTRLGFLTDRRRRTLAQAAVRFVLGLPGVVSAVCEFHSPRTIREVEHIETVPPIAPEEIERISQLGPAPGGR